MIEYHNQILIFNTLFQYSTTFYFGGMVKLAIIADLHSAVPESYSGTSTSFIVQILKYPQKY